MELHRQAGTQLDPLVVAALERALVRHVWEPTRLEPILMVTAGQAFVAGVAGTDYARVADDGRERPRAHPVQPGVVDSEPAP